MTDQQLVAYFAANPVGYACSKSACVGWSKTTGKADPAVADLFTAIQAAINVGLKQLKRPTIATDGLIGSGTVGAYNLVRAAWPGIGGPGVASKEAFAAAAYGIYLAVRLGRAGIFNTPPIALPGGGGSSGGGGGGGSLPPPSTDAEIAAQVNAGKLPPSEAAKVFVKKNKTVIAGGLGLIALAAFLLKHDPAGGKKSDSEI